MKSYKDLTVYQKGYELTLQVYRLTQEFPKEEMYGLTSQMRRAAVSIPSNIAEGYRRGSRKEYIQFLRIAFGSCSELETQVSLAYDLKFLSDKDRNTLIDSVNGVEKMLAGLIKALRK